MSIRESIKSSFSEEAQPVDIIENELQFKRKLNIGDEAYSYLTNAKNLHDFVGALVGGGAISAFSYLGWMGSLGVVSQLGLAIGVVATPIGLIALAGGVGAASAFAITKLRKQVDDSAYTKIPKFINTPLDVLAVNILEAIGPLAVKIALADGHFDQSEKKHIIKFLSSEWGYNKDFINAEINTFIERSFDYSYSTLREYLDDTFIENKEINVPNLKEHLIELAEEIVILDGVITEDEMHEILLLKEALFRPEK